MFVISVGYSLC